MKIINESSKAGRFCGCAARVYWLLYFRGDPSDAELFSIVRRLYVYRDLL
jgi:hypothetical protein